MTVNNRPGPSTLAVHGGEERLKPQDTLVTALHMTSTYTFEHTPALVEYMEGRKVREEYGRYGNPTQRAAERKLAALEGAEACLLFSSGMAAMTGALLGMLGHGAHVIVTSDGYRRTRQFLSRFLPRYGIAATIVAPADYEALEAAISPKTRAVVSESPTNPYLNVLDIPRVVEIGRRHNVKVIIDATFATPYNVQPLALGVDLVVHSATKYLGGHNDLLAGAVLGSDALVSAIRDAQAMLGAVPDPHACYLLLRGLKTFPLRMARQNENGQAIAEALWRHRKVRRVFYPGLENHPHHDIAAAQMRGFGGVVSFEIDGDGVMASRFVDALRIPFIAPSFGGVESLVEQPALMSYFELSREERLEIGIPDELVRYSAGIEDKDDLIADIEQALEKV
jgi:cystathionine gamma-synthase